MPLIYTPIYCFRISTSYFLLSSHTPFISSLFLLNSFLIHHCTNSLSSLHIFVHHCTFCASLHVKTSPDLRSPSRPTSTYWGRLPRLTAVVDLLYLYLALSGIF